jgi:hypothetical protein
MICTDVPLIVLSSWAPELNCTSLKGYFSNEALDLLPQSPIHLIPLSVQCGGSWSFRELNAN